MNSHSLSTDLPSAGVWEYWNTKATARFALLDHLSPRGCTQELTAAHRAIDDELSALHMITCAMRTRRNNFSLIGRLPPEVLSCIFSFHAINQPISRDPIYNPDDPFPSNLSPTRVGLGWITVTHICRHWRQVALSDPNLWRTIVFDLGAEWAEEMLARSKAALIFYCRDLSFQPRVSRRRSLDDEVTLRKHLSHVRRLVLSGSAESLAPAMRALTTPSPHLESLELLQNAPHIRELCITLPSDMFTHAAPKLRRVTLFGCAVSWDSPLFRDLTHLDVRIPPAAQTDLLAIPSLDRLLSILEAMPSLQALTLGNCLPIPDSTSRLVPLRHMNKLSLEGSLSETVAILERVSLPGSASLSLRCPDRDPLDGLLDTLVSLLAAHFRAPGTSNSPLSTITIDEAEYALSFTIMAWDTDVSLYHPPSAPARLHLTFSSLHKTLVEFLSLQVCKALPLKDLHTLSLTCPGATWTTAGWADVCNHCPKVTHLRLGGSWLFTLAPTLTERTVFPALVTLALQDVNFFASLSPECVQPLGVILPAFLRARRNAGSPVRRVEITSCDVARIWVESFSEFVNEVVWDYDQGHDSQPTSAFDEDSWSDD